MEEKQYGYLTVIGNSKSRKGYVICKCKCGNIKEIRKTSLTKKDAPTLSCGCIQKTVASQTGIKTIEKNSEEKNRINKKFNTNFQVIQNSNLPKNNKSGHKGIWYNPQRKKYEAFIQVHGKRKHLGRYKTIDEAIMVREKAEQELFQPLIDSKEERKNNV